MTAVFDGHNDALGRLQGDDVPARDFLTGLPEHQLDLPRCRAGGFAGGLFAINAPSPQDFGTEAGPIDPAAAAAFTLGALGRAHALAAASGGAVVIATSIEELDRARADDVLAIVLHLEGAEAIDPGLAALEALHAAGVRSIGPVWSRPNAFGRGVPFRFPSSPDTGPGLTDAGRALVRRCAELGIAIDVSHLTAAGFDDVARLACAPIIASHSACHALCPASRNLTDEQLRTIADSGGLVGIVFTPPFVRTDGRDDPDTPVSVVAAHARHAADIAGVDHVALGSDFDGAPISHDLPDVTALPRLVEALRDAGFTAAEVEAIAWGNWRRVLSAAWA